MPNVRSVFFTSSSRILFCFFSSDGRSSFTRTLSSSVLFSSKSKTFFGLKIMPFFSFAYGLLRILERSSVAARLDVGTSLTFRRSVLPTSSSTVRMPSFAIYSLNSSAIKRMKLMTYSGFPANLFLSSGFWVAIPTGQVSRLHTRIITHPMVTSGAVANPNSSAPRSAAIATSRPLISLPSVSIRTLSLSPFWISV